MYKISKMVWASKIVWASKTTIKKITAKITTTALLFFLLLFTLTTNLKAQAVQDNSKSGFFAGFVYLQGFQVDTSKSITTSPTTSYRVTDYTDETTYIIADAASLYDTAVGTLPVLSPGIEALFKANCETGTTTSIDSNGGLSFRYGEFVSFDPGKKPTLAQLANGDATVTFNSVANPFPTGKVEGETSLCYRYFYGNLSSARTPFVFSEYEVTADSGTPQVSAESDKLSGVGLQFGYRGEKWRASFTHYTGKGGDNELTNSLAIVDYFFQEKFFVGAGLASMQLTNSSAGSSISASATSPVLQVGYTENLTKNLQLSIGVLQYSSGLSLSSTTATTTTPTITYLTEKQTATNVGDSATIGANLIPPAVGVNAVFSDIGPFDYRTEVTQVGERTVNIQKTVTPVEAETTTIEAELKAPTVISISLHLSF